MSSVESLTLVTGPLLMGSMFSYFLDGAFAIQVYHYYMNYASTDRSFFVYLVCIAVLIELIHIVFSTHTTYGILALGFGNPMVFVETPFSGAALPALNAAVGLCTQLFFAWRIAALSKSTVWGKISAVVVALMAGMQCAAGFAVSVQFTLIRRNLGLLPTLNRTVIVWLAGSFACDILISVCMVVVLMHAKGTTSYVSSKNILNALIVHTIENGVVTTVCALATLLSFLLYPETFFYICFEYLLGRLYANVLLAALNGRRRMAAAATGDHEFSLAHSTGGMRSTNQVQLSTFQKYPGKEMSHGASKTAPQPMVSITKEVHVDSDDGHGTPSNKASTGLPVKVVAVLPQP